MEDKKMMAIIHENHLKQRRIIKKEKVTFLDKFTYSAIGILAFLGLMFLVAIIENMNF